MSLTANDLQKIGNLIDDKLEKKLEEKLEKKFNQKLKPIHQKIDKMNKKLDTTISYFDTVTTKHQRRIKNIEQYLDIKPPPEFV